MYLIFIYSILVLSLLAYIMNRKRKSSPECNSNSVDQECITETDSGGKFELGSRKNTKSNHNVASFADIRHKKTTGENNWKNFLQSQPQSVRTIQNTNKTPISPLGLTNKHRPTPTPNVSITSSEDRLPTKMKSNFTGKKDMSSKPAAQQNLPITLKRDSKPMFGEKSSEPVLTKQVAMDCEMVGVEVGVNGSMLARVSLVNAHGDCIYDKYVAPTEPIQDYRTPFSGIRPQDLINATDFKTVQKEVSEILKGKILVGHALKNDLSVLYLTHPRYAIRDTSKFNKFRNGRTPALKKLAKEYLGVTIQDGEHSSIQDALATMQLYKMFKKEWEVSRRNEHKKQMSTNCKKGSSFSHANSQNTVDV